MTKNKIKITIFATVFSFIVLGFVLPNFVFAQSYFTEFPDYHSKWQKAINSWGDTHYSDQGLRSWNETSINLPHSGEYDIFMRYSTNSGASQGHEEFKILMDGVYIGHTTDANTGHGYEYIEAEYLGEHNFTAGNHIVRAEHLWNYSDYGTQSVFPMGITFSLKEIPNNPPVANAGADKEMHETEFIILQGSGYDPDGDLITYSWSCNGGSLSGPNFAHPLFHAPAVSQNTNYVCILDVEDSHNAHDTDSMNVLVKNAECTPWETQTQNCGNCGTQTKTCKSDYTWGNWGNCNGQGECSQGETQTQNCGLGGTQTKTCSSNCSWENWGNCNNQGQCTPWETQTQNCGNCGTQTKTCKSDYTWETGEIVMDKENVLKEKLKLKTAD